MSVLPLLLVAVLGQTAEMDAWLKEKPAAFEAYKNKCREATAAYVAEEIFKLEEALAGAKERLTRFESVPVKTGAARGNTQKNGKVIFFGSKELKERAIAEQKAIIEKAESKIPELKGMLEKKQSILLPLEELKTNSIGVVKVVRVKQVTAPTAFVGRLEGFDEDLWITYTTKSAVDGESYKLPENTLAVVLGTKMYATAAGSTRTIRHVGLFKCPERDDEQKAPE